MMAGIWGQPAHASGVPTFCSLESGFDVRRIRHFGSSGDQALDRAMIAEVRKINTAFGIRPGYRFFEDASPNALAWNQTLVAQTRGTVFLGVNLIREELSARYGGAAVAGIAAHEGAHVVQFFSDGMARLAAGRTARDFELHADFLAGYYFGITGRTERSIDVFGNSLFSKGDYDFNDEHHHGTPDERLAAMHAGYRVADRGHGLGQAIREGIDHAVA